VQEVVLVQVIHLRAVLAGVAVAVREAAVAELHQQEHQFQELQILAVAVVVLL
jgi:hypothetical protein